MHVCYQFSSVVSDSLRPHRQQHARPPCSSPTPRVYSNSCPLVGDAIQPSHPVSPFSLASGSFKMSQLSASGGQSIGVSASTSVPPMNAQDWSPLGWNGLISLHPRDSQESSTSLFKSMNSSALSFLYSLTLTFIHDYWKNHSLDETDLCW